MSVYKPKNSPFYQFDFQVRGRRFHGSTGRTSRREAEKVETAEREKAKSALKRGPDNTTLLTLDQACGRYWTEVGQHHACANETWANIERLLGCPHLGKNKRLCDIRDDDVTKMVAWRRGHRRWGRKGDRLVSNATVNRSTTEVLQKIFSRAKRKWGARFDDEPAWKEHMLPEASEHVRELRGDEADRLDAAMRDDYEPFFEFARMSGLRLSECLLRWSDVDWTVKEIRKKGKGGKIVRTPITPEVRALLLSLSGHDPTYVFTYVARRTRGLIVKGRRYPITFNGVKSTWRRIRKHANISNFRFHDFRHDFGTKLLRGTGNLKTVQKALNHADIKTTMRYAHVQTDEVTDAIASLQESRKKSRSVKREAG